MTRIEIATRLLAGWLADGVVGDESQLTEMVNHSYRMAGELLALDAAAKPQPTPTPPKPEGPSYRERLNAVLFDHGVTIHDQLIDDLHALAFAADRETGRA
jgi:hypothetical protein